MRRESSILSETDQREQSRSDRIYVKTESHLEYLAVLTCQELYLHVFYVCTHVYMCSEGRVEVQNRRTAFQVCFA